MNRIDRLFAILLILQTKAQVRAQDLAERFEVSKRTIYRDITALCESGIPVVSMPGEGYELMEGFYLPPLVFNDREAIALFLGAQLLSQQATGAATVDAEHALAKLSVVLPGEILQRVKALTDIIQFITPKERFNLDAPELLTLQRAIQNQQVIYIRYHSYSQDEVTERGVEPHQLYYADGVWYVEGYCQLRQDMRLFRLSRIKTFKVQPNRFAKREQQRQLAAADTTVQIRFAAEVVPWVRERQHYGFLAETRLPDQTDMVMTYRLNRISEIVPWVLSWGASAEVLTPRSLREQIRQEAIKLAHMLT